MSKQRSFLLSDFSLRDVPAAIVVYVILSALCVLAGLALETMPLFWRGLLSGVGLGLCGALILLTLRKPRRKDVARTRVGADSPCDVCSASSQSVVWLLGP